MSVSTAVSGRNLSDLSGVKALLIRLGISRWRLVAIMPIGRATSQAKSFDGQRLRTLRDFAGEIDSRQLRIRIGDNLPFLGDWEKKVRTAPLMCPVGLTVCCIGVDGYVRGCPEMPETEANREGSILESSLSWIWQRGFARYRNRTILEADGRCATCRSKHKCNGCCWVMREGGRQRIHSLLVQAGARSRQE